MRDNQEAELVFSMPETTCYILDGKKPVLCHDTDVWQKFMDDISGRTVAFDIVGTFQIRTAFMGVNIGSADAPKFFKMTIVGGNEGHPPIWAESWKRAIREWFMPQRAHPKSRQNFCQAMRVRRLVTDLLPMKFCLMNSGS